MPLEIAHATSGARDIRGAELKSAAFPSPPLRKLFRFNNEATGVVPSYPPLPRLIALRHDEPGFKRAEEFLKGLAAGTRVGLESDDVQIMSREARLLHAQESCSFSQLALVAERQGLLPIPIERSTTLYRASVHSSIEERYRLIRQRDSVGRTGYRAHEPIGLGIRQLVKFIADGLRIRRLEKLITDGLVVKTTRPLLTSAWRSELMAREIARRPWRSHDVVITGSAHTLNLSVLFGVPVDTFIGSYNSPKELAAEMASIMKGQVKLARALARLRRWKRLFFCLRNPRRSKLLFGRRWPPSPSPSHSSPGGETQG